jgi:uncharacterized protein (TIGR00299 family) protein
MTPDSSHTLLIEPFGGMAGDMFLAALLDLGASQFELAHLRELAQRLVPGEFELELCRARRGALEGAHLLVRTPESREAPHRHLADLEAMIDAADLPRPVSTRSQAVLRRIAEAEARVHGIPIERVHFHEVGAVDTLIDVCGACLALELLGVERVLATPPLAGGGSVRCAHGEMPVPAPAVSELFRGLPLRHGGGSGERLTPTAAGLLAELVDEFIEGASGEATLRTGAVGYGAGTRDPEEGPPNLVRVQLCASEATETSACEVWQLDVQLDDATGEELGWCLAGLREAGALDAWSTPVQMKKDRPGVQLSALCRKDGRQALEAVIFERTQSLGLRWTHATRSECAREIRELELEGVRVRVKLRHRPDYPGRSAFGERDVSPEYEDLVILAGKTGWTLREAERRVVVRWLELA